jgi:hypothetical protein
MLEVVHVFETIRRSSPLDYITLKTNIVFSANATKFALGLSVCTSRCISESGSPECGWRPSHEETLASSSKPK